MDPYVIVGNGVAAISAVEAIRAGGDTTPILILTDQECAFYSRPSLYYVLLGRIELDDAWGRPQSWYEENGVEVRCNTYVTKINPQDHSVEAERGISIEYSKLLLAVGTRGRVLPWADRHLRGVVTLNTLADVVTVSELLSTAKRAVIVGGGLTSIELVEACRRWEVETTFVMWADRFLDKQLTSEEAELVHRRLRDGGVDVRVNEEVTEVRQRDDAICAAALKRKGEELPCELIGCAVGVAPNAGLAEQAGAETEQGIVVDDRMCTTLPDVSAAGDCSQLRRSDGRPARSEMLWYVAGDMGSVAGANMAGGDARYHRRVFLNAAEFCGLDFAGVGDIVPGQPGVEETVIRDRNGGGSVRLVTRDGVLVGACFLGDIRLADIARGLIAAGARLADLRPDHPIRALAERGSP